MDDADDANPWDPTDEPVTVDDAPDQPGPDEATDDEPTDDEPTGTEAADDVPTDDGPSDRPVDPVPEPDGEPDPSRTKVIIGAVVAFAVIAAAGLFLSQGGDDTAPERVNGGGGNSQPQNETVQVVGTTDTFDRPDSRDSLGALPNGSVWQVGAGTWGIQANQAYLPNAATDRRNFATVGIGNSEGQAQVRMAKVKPDAGLTFRYKGPFNYWAVVAVPEVATWNIVRVVDGAQEVVGNTGGQSPIADGTTVGVRLLGDTIEVIINGQVLAEMTDDALAGVGKVGMTAKGAGSAEVRFDDFVAGGPDGQAIVAPGPPGGDGTATTAPASTTAPG